MERYNEKSQVDITKENFLYSFKFTYQEGLSYDYMTNPNKSINGNKTSTDSLDKEKNVMGSIYEPLFTIENKYTQKVLHPENDTKKIPIRKFKCNKTKLRTSEFYDILIKKESNLDEDSFMLENQICFNYSDYKLYGKYSDNSLSYLEITLKLNETYYKQNLEKLKIIMSGAIFKFSLFYSDHTYDITNLKNPIVNRVESTIYSYVDINFYERVDVFFNKLNYSSDKNLLYKQPARYEKIKYFSSHRSFLPIGFRFDTESSYPDKFHLVKYFIRPDLTETVVSVAYQKFPEFISVVSAFSLNIFVGLSFICGIYNRLSAQKKIISKTMKFSDFFGQTHKKQIEYFIKVSIANKKNAIKNFTNKNQCSQLDYNKNDKIKDKKVNNKDNNYNENKDIDKSLFFKTGFENCSSLSLKNNYHNTIKSKSKSLRDIHDNNHMDNMLCSKKCKIYTEGKNELNNINTSLIMDKSIIKLGVSLPVIQPNPNNEKISSNQDIIHKKYRKISDSSRSNEDMIRNNSGYNSDLTLPDSNAKNNINGNVLKFDDKNNVLHNKNHNLLNKLNKTKVNLSSDMHEDNKKNKIELEIKNFTKKVNNLTILSNETNDCFKNKDSKKFNTLKITCFDLFAKYICCKDLKQKKFLYNLAEIRFNENLNFLNYTRKMMEFDIVKYLILDKNLLEMMNFVSKPNISEEAEYAYKDQEYNNFFNLENLKGNEKNFQMNKIKDAYENLLSSSDLCSDSNSFVKQRMIKLFHFQLQELK